MVFVRIQVLNQIQLYKFLQELDLTMMYMVTKPYKFVVVLVYSKVLLLLYGFLTKLLTQVWPYLEVLQTEQATISLQILMQTVRKQLLV